MKATLFTTTIAVASTVLVTACGTPAQQSSMTSYPSGTSSYSSTQPAYTSQYGYVDSIQVVTNSQSGSTGVGAVVGGIVGGIVGNQVGGGTGKSVATVAGVVGGAVVGNNIEQNNRASSRDVYQITVRLDNGSYQSVQQDSMIDLQRGTRVRIENGRVYRY